MGEEPHLLSHDASRAPQKSPSRKSNRFDETRTDPKADLRTDYTCHNEESGVVTLKSENRERVSLNIY